MIDLANKPESYLKLNEKGTVPTFINSDGSILTESDDSQFLS
jgi:glutathione S-transferase